MTERLNETSQNTQNSKIYVVINIEVIESYYTCNALELASLAVDNAVWGHFSLTRNVAEIIENGKIWKVTTI